MSFRQTHGGRSGNPEYSSAIEDFSTSNHAGLRARTKALMNLPSTSGAIFSASRSARVKNSCVGRAIDARRLDLRPAQIRRCSISPGTPTLPALRRRIRSTARRCGGCRPAPRRARRRRRPRSVPPAQHAKRFGQHAILVGRKIDHAVGNDHVHRVIGQRNVLDLALEELDVLAPALRWFSRARASISSVMSRP